MTDLAKKRRFKGLDTLFYFFTKYTCFLVFKIYHRAERFGFKNAPLKGPYIVIANHASFLDPWYLGVLFRARHIRYLITTKWYLKNKVLKFFFDLYGCVPVNPHDMDPSSIKATLRILREGGVVGIFPEGRVCFDGNMQEFNPGALYVAMRAGVPVIPVTICGSYEMLPRHKVVPKPVKLRIVVGRPIVFSDDHKEKKNSKDFYVHEMEKIKSWMADQLAQFEDEKQKGK